jgi:hypothetical protein
MNEQTQQGLQELISSLQIRNVQFQDIHSRRMMISFQPESLTSGSSLNWNQQFADDDPLTLDDGSLVFRPKYSFTVKNGEAVIFEATMICALRFSVENRDFYEKGWANEEVRKVFLEKQIMRLMWTILRQQLMDCMNRHSMTPVPLPWIL